MLDVIEYFDKHFLFREAGFCGRGIVVVSAVVNDTVHVQVEIVKLGDAVLGDELGNGGIALREPAEEFGDTC
jgi:hypothetical protein